MLMLHRAVRTALLPLLTLLLAGFVSVGTAPSAAGRGRLPLLGLLHRHGRRLRRPGDRARPAPRPKDGDIEGYRYAAPANFDKPNLPRADLTEVTFDAVCGDKSAEAGEKRVAVLARLRRRRGRRRRRDPAGARGRCAPSCPRRPTASRRSRPSRPTSARRSRRSARCSAGSAATRPRAAPTSGAAGQPRRRPAVEFTGLAGDEARPPGDASDTSAASDSDSDDSNTAAAGRPRGPRGRDRGRRLSCSSRRNASS